MPDGNAAAQRVLGIAKVLQACNYEVRFCGLSHLITSGKEEGIIEGFSYSNYPYPTSVISWLRYLGGYDFTKSEIDKYNPDIVILYNHPAFAIERIAKHCKKRGIKVYGDITEWYDPQGNLIHRIIKSYDISRRMKKSNLKLDGLICISRFLTEYYKNKRVKTIEIPPLIDLKQDKWHQTHEIFSKEVRLVYGGSPGSNKDRLDLILNTLDLLSSSLNIQIRFDIIGITKEQYQKLWNDNLNRNYVIFHGRKPHNEVIKFLLEADFQIFLRPDTLANKAGFPTKFVEAVTSNTIPITNLNSNLLLYLSDGVNGFICKSLTSADIYSVLTKALTLSKQDISLMKSNLSATIFDYREYVGILSHFIQ